MKTTIDGAENIFKTAAFVLYKGKAALLKDKNTKQQFLATNTESLLQMQEESHREHSLEAKG